MADEKILYEVKDKIAWITLNRPESLNAVNRDMVKAIVGYCRAAEDDPNVQVVIFKANGERAFSVGGDIKDRARANEAGTVEPVSPLVARQEKHNAIPGTPAPAIAAMNKITIALVHGYTVGTGLADELGLRHSHRRRRRATRRQRSSARVYVGFGRHAALAALGRLAQSVGDLSFRRIVRRRGMLPHRLGQSAGSLRSAHSCRRKDGRSRFSKARRWRCAISRKRSTKAWTCRWTKGFATSPICKAWSCRPKTPRKGRARSSKSGRRIGKEDRN